MNEQDNQMYHEYKKILDDAECQQLEALNENPTLLNALKKILLHKIYYQGVLKPGSDPDPSLNWIMTLAAREDMTNEHLGADIKGRVFGVKIVNSAFKEIEKFRKVVVNNKYKINEAR